MTFDSNTVIAIGTCLGLIISFGKIAFSQSRRLNRLELQVETMWDKYLKTWEFLRDRGEIEAVHKGLAKHNSPLSIDASPQKDTILRVYEPLIPKIEEVIESCKGNLEADPDDPIIFEAVGTKLGKQLVDTVCQDLKVDHGACVSLAIAVVRYKRKKAIPQLI